MDVYIDQTQLEHDATTLAGAIDAARPRVLEQGRLIVEVRLDGRVLDESEMDSLAEAASPGEQLHLITANPVDLCIQALEDVRHEGLTAARAAQQEAAGKLQVDDADAAMENVRQALSLWQQCQQAVGQTAQLLQIEIDELTVGDEPAVRIVDRLADRLTRTREQITSSDWLALADSLGYDMDAAVDEWERLLDVMIAEARQRGSDDGSGQPDGGGGAEHG